MGERCEHKSGSGIRWTGGRYCLGCGLPVSVIGEEPKRTLMMVLRASLADTRWWQWRVRHRTRQAIDKLERARVV